MKRKHQLCPVKPLGFTLIELMIAVAIVGVLAAIAIPAFGNYLTRARITEAVNYAQSCKTGVIEYHTTQGRLPDNTDEANCQTMQTDNVEKVEVLNGVISVTLRNGANSALPGVLQNKVITLQPLSASEAVATDSDRILSWHCGIANATSNGQNVWDYIPASCRQTPK
ncbi:MAG: prepilin-type N-terminal cleavage/methylation domain-containing protein [Limnobacter sp.]|nr:prepilin-type N-terminal cleavage/methylation domain-containing protein [Limnobacter sp.]